MILYDIWYGMIWYIWYDMIWYGIIYDMWYDIWWYDMIWYGMIWYDMIWYDMIWYDMVWCVIRYDMIYDMKHLLTAFGLTPSSSSTVHIYTQTIHEQNKETGFPELNKHKNKKT